MKLQVTKEYIPFSILLGEVVLLTIVVLIWLIR